MDGQQQRAGRGRRRNKRSRSAASEKAEPILIAARRPNAPISPKKRPRHLVVASASPHPPRGERRAGSMQRDGIRAVEAGAGENQTSERLKAAGPDSTPRRSARIVELKTPDQDDQELRRQRLLDRLRTSQGRGAISRAAEEFRLAGFDFPLDQEIQLQLLEHFDEECARSALESLTHLLEHEAPIKRPVFEQRLRRLEEYADEEATREAAAHLRRAIRA